MRKYLFFVGVFCFVLALKIHRGECFSSYTDICKALTDQKGWSANECEGMNMQGPMGNMVTANRSYTRGNKKVDVIVMNGMSAMGYWAPFQAQMQMETKDEFIKIMQIKGFNVGISYKKKEKEGAVVVSFGLQNTSGMMAGVMVFNFSNMDWKEALSFAKKFDWNKIKNFFK